MKIKCRKCNELIGEVSAPDQLRLQIVPDSLIPDGVYGPDESDDMDGSRARWWTDATMPESGSISAHCRRDGARRVAVGFVRAQLAAGESVIRV